jgi:hypothetical protein
MFTSAPESIARAFGTTTIQWSPEAATYQGCRSDATAPVPHLIPVQRWSSKKDIPAESITAVTHISLDKLVTCLILVVLLLFYFLRQKLTTSKNSKKFSL